MSKLSNAHLLVNVRDRVGSTTYQNATFNAVGENIIQGQIKKISVSEVLFPYDIPNVLSGYNIFELYTVAPSPPALLTIVVPPGFYTGTELAADITAEIIAQGAAEAVPIVPADLPTCTYDAISNRFTFVAPAGPASPYENDWVLASPYTFPFNYVGVATPLLGKDLLSIMGFKTPTGTGQIGVVGGNQIAVGGSAPLLFTQYIDICSPQLCQYQFFRDGTTTNLARRLDVVCRLYIDDETSMPGFDISGNALIAGTRPFVIHRQFKNERIMRWTADSAVGTLNLLLFDDIGQPITPEWQPRPYQITFLAYEMDNCTEQNGGYRY